MDNSFHVVPRPYKGIDATLGIGTAVGDAIGTVGHGIGKAGLAVGSLGASAAIGAAGMVGRAAFWAAPRAAMYTGKAAFGTAGFLINGYGPLGSPIVGAAKLTKNVAQNMVEYKGSHLQYNHHLKKLERKGPSMHLTKFGLGVVGGLAAIQGLRGGYNEYMGSRMGRVDSKVTSLTPDYSPQEYKIQHPDFAGATGDLVFAMHANRRG